MKTLEERVENIEKVIRENFNNLGPKVVKVDAKPSETSSSGGYVYLYCGGCNKSLGSITESKSPDLNYCSQCGTKIELDDSFYKAIEQIKHAKEIYEKVNPLKMQVDELIKKVGKKS